MSRCCRVFREGRLGFVQAVGSDNPTGSHFEAQDQIEHGEAYGHNLGGGWLGRHLRSRSSRRRDSPLSGVAIGATLPESLRGAPPPARSTRSTKSSSPPPPAIRRPSRAALSGLYATEVGILGQQGKQTLDLLQRVEAAPRQALHARRRSGIPGRRLRRRPARNRPASSRPDLGLEVACIDLGGWDTHFFQGTTGGLQAGPIDTLARGLAAFDADLKGYRDRVTTIVMTEFGRRLYENGSAGTDHGRGFAFLAMGEHINGGKIHGDWPGLKEEPASPAPAEWKSASTIAPCSPRLSRTHVRCTGFESLP